MDPDTVAGNFLVPRCSPGFPRLRIEVFVFRIAVSSCLSSDAFLRHVLSLSVSLVVQNTGRTLFCLRPRRVQGAPGCRGGKLTIKL